MISAAALVGAAVVLLIAAYVFLDPLVRWQARSYLEDTLQTPVRLRSVRILLAGGARIEGLTILIPEGFQEREAFHMESLEAVTRVSAIMGNPIVVTELRIRQPEFILAFGEKETNWAALIRNASRELAIPEEKPNEPGRRFVIRNVQVIQPLIRVSPTKLFPKGLLIRLNDVTLDRVGNDPSSPSPFYLTVAALIQAVITGETSDGTEIPSVIRSRLTEELQEGGRAFTEALSPKQ